MSGVFEEGCTISEFTMDCAERHKIASITGEWYCYQWWLEDKYYNSKNPFIRKQAETGFNELIEVFDAKWMLKQSINGTPSFIHPLANWLLAEGPYFFQLFCLLGLDLHRIREAGLLRNLERRLKNHQEYWESAVFELRLLSHLRSEGFYVEPDYKSGKGKKGNCNCDFKISKGIETIFLEIKRPKDMHRRNEGICEKSFNLFLTSLYEGGEIKNPGELFLPIVELRKIFTHISKAVNKQLPSYGAGGVIVESSWPFDFWEEFEVMAKRRFKKKDRYGHLSFIAVVKNFFSGDQCRFEHRIKILFNPEPHIDVCRYNVLQEIRSLELPLGADEKNKG